MLWVNLYIFRFLLIRHRGYLMTWSDWACLGMIIVGFALFLIGANIYNAIIGYSGIYLFIGAIAAYLIIYLYKELTKKTPIIQKP